MTKRENEVRKRPWLKMRVFCITASLQRKMAVDETLTEKEREWLSYIQNKVLIEGRKDDKWANIGATYFLDKIGGGYRRWVDRLVEWGELEVNESYKAAAGSGFTKSYQVPLAAKSTGTTTITFLRKKIQPPRPKPPITTGGVAFDWADKNLRRLTVAESLLVGPNAITSAMVHESCWRIFYGDFNLRRGAVCRRLYHAVIEMAKEGRANLKLIDSSDTLYEYDVKSCHPVLLLDLFTDPTERLRYSELLDVDIYDGVAAVMKKELSRDEVKEDFMAAINPENRKPSSLGRKWVYRFFRQEFPIFTEQVLNVRTDLAVELQSLEADLMVDELGRFCSENDLFWIPCHDGWMSTLSTEQKIVGKVRDIFQSRCGYSVAVSRVDLVSRSTILLHSYSGSYVRVNDTSPPPSVLEKVESVGVPTDPTPPQNPWKKVVEEWGRLHDPKELQEGAINRAEGRERQRVTVKRLKKDMDVSKELAKQAREAVQRRGGQFSCDSR